MSKFKAYNLMLASLPAGVSEHEYLLDTDFFHNMENSDVLEADVRAHVRVDHKNDTYYLHCHLEGMLQIACDRCLDPMDHPVDADYDMAVKYGPDYDDSADGLLVIPETDASLNLAYMLYDTAILTIPMRHVHPQGACNKAMAGLLRSHNAKEEGEEPDTDEFPDEEMD